MQRMRGEPAEGGVPNPDDPGVVGIFADLSFYTEGGVVTMTVKRLGGRIDQDISFGYRFTSQAGDADFETSPSGTETLRGHITDVVISVDTVDRSGTQGDRSISCTFTGISNGTIDPAQSVATTLLKDKTTTPTDKWWLLDSWRSGRRWRGGAGYFNQIANYNQYEQQVAYLDCLVGPNTGGSDQAVQTPDLAFGGPANNPNTILKGSQLDWTQSYEFSVIFKDAANKTGQNRILGWVCDWMPVSARTDNPYDAAAQKKFWEDVKKGDYDAYMKAVGARVMLNCQRINLDPKWVHARPFHEMQQTNFYQVWEISKGLYKDAMNRMIDKYKEGAQFDLRVAFSPAKDKIWSQTPDKGKPAIPKQNFGAIESWAPERCDYLSMSFHPAKAHNSHAEFNKFMNGTDSIYGVNNEVLEWCVKYGKPLGPLEWSPRYQSNLIADSIYNWYYREHLWPRVGDVGIVCEAVYDQRTLDKNAANDQADQTAAGKQNWSDGVDVFKHFWKGKGPNWTGYTPFTTLPPEWYPS